MSIMTEKQQNFIASLVHRKAAYAGSDGMTIGMTAYPTLDLEAALEGHASKNEASKIIEVLLAAEDVRKPVGSPISPKQLNFIDSLLKKTGQSRKTADLLEMSSKEASALISELLELSKTAA